MNILKLITNGLVKKPQRKKYTSVTEEITFNKLGGVPKDHPFTHREFPGAFKEVEDETRSNNNRH